MARKRRARRLRLEAIWRAHLLHERGTLPVIPNNSTRKRFHAFDRDAYKRRNLIERAFCRLKDWRRVSTRYDKLARNFHAAVIVAAISGDIWSTGYLLRPAIDTLLSSVVVPSLMIWAGNLKEARAGKARPPESGTVANDHI